MVGLNGGWLQNCEGVSKAGWFREATVREHCRNIGKPVRLH